MQINATQGNGSAHAAGMRRNGPPPMSEEQREKFLDAASSALGMSSDDLKAELDSGKRLDEIAKDKGVSEEDLRAALDKAPGRPERGGQHGPRMDGQSSQMVQEVLNSVADKLGVSGEALSGVKSGADLRDLASKAGISEEQLAGILEDAFSTLMPYGPQGTQDSGNWGAMASQVDKVA